ncbi:MAG TPA: preprotein translocase subunit YajC [Gammaproteobacteria bacterium]|nr:preprotein translocase subunit YajC [Gammaproteobacteria bacterium]
MSFFVSDALADTAAQAAQPAPAGISFITMFLIFVFIVYFAIWRPQSKRAKEQRDLLTSLAKGDEVVTAGGLLGRVQKITDQHIVLGITDNTDIIIQKESVTSILPKGTMQSIQK